ncbi:hypothetical protein EI555_016233 [Monodon monoceros]|uniref:Non-selective voltage-gated ion channel VDAC2 n=1 Tax=Monodon monoceros TaxID=40151 RepID=A0A4U1FFF7_MONMO|nr:hypothetical protein EI555_016233 [Monodon monoceros]
MCIPPSYADLGKAARDIFNQGFGFGLVKLDVKTKSCSGVEFSTSGSSNADTGKKCGKIKFSYKRECINLGCGVDFAGPGIHGSAVFGYEGWLAGYQMTFDSAKSKLTRNNLAVGLQDWGLPATH